MKSYTRISIGLFCALALSSSACGKKEEKAEAKPTPSETKPAPEAETKTPPTPVEVAKPVDAEPPVAPAADAQEAAVKFELSAKDMGKGFEKALGNGKISAFGTEFTAKDLCNETTILNPDTVEVFETGTPDQLVVLCPGGLDGETNVVTVFEKGKDPRTESMSPPDSSNRVEDEVLDSTVKKIFGS